MNMRPDFYTWDTLLGITLGTSISVVVLMFFVYLFDKDEWEATKRFFGGGYKKSTWRDWMYWP